MNKLLLLVFPILFLGCSQKEEMVTEQSSVRTVTIKSTLSPEITPMSNQREATVDPSSYYNTWGYTVRLIDSEGNEYVVNDYNINDDLSFENVVGEAKLKITPSEWSLSVCNTSSYYLNSDEVTIPSSSSSVSVEMYNRDWGYVEVWGDTEDITSITIQPEDAFDDIGESSYFTKQDFTDVFYTYINTLINKSDSWTLRIKSPEGITTTSFDAEADQSYSFQLLPSETDSTGNSLQIHMDINPGFQSESHDFVIEGPSKKEEKLGVVYSSYNGIDYDYDTTWLQKNGNLYVLDADSLYTNGNTDRYFSIIDFENDKSYRQISPNDKYNSYGDYSRSIGDRSFYLPKDSKLVLNEQNLTFNLEMPVPETLFMVGSINEWDVNNDQYQLQLDESGNFYINVYLNAEDEFKFITQLGDWGDYLGFNSGFSFLVDEFDNNFRVSETGNYAIRHSFIKCVSTTRGDWV